MFLEKRRRDSLCLWTGGAQPRRILVNRDVDQVQGPRTRSTEAMSENRFDDNVGARLMSDMQSACVLQYETSGMPNVVYVTGICTYDRPVVILRTGTVDSD